MVKKYLFFDIDGTLTNDNPGGIVLDSTKQTIKKLQENGHFVAIASGRAHWMAMDACEMTGIYNLVHDGGNGLTLNGQLQYIKPLDRELSLTLIDELLKNDLSFEVVIDDTPIHYTHVPKSGSVWQIKVVENLNYHDLKEIYKIFINLDYEQIQAYPEIVSLCDQLGYMFYPNTGVIVEPTDKYQGIVEMVKLVGGDLNEIVVFGDGTNDISMFEHAPMSIAMANGVDKLKEIATFITKSNKENGIEYACKYFGWID